MTVTSAVHKSSPVLVARGLNAGYDGIPVVHGLDLVINQGEVVALLGANGAGKTTTLLTIAGLLPPISGSLTVLGEVAHDERGRGRRVRRNSLTRTWRRARRGLSLVPEDRGLFPGLTVNEHLRLSKAKTNTASTNSDILDLFPALAPLRTRQAGLLSGGEQQMLAIARALGTKPKLLMVDEMSLGLAPIIVERLLPLVRSAAAATGAGVLIVEQHVHMALAVSDRAAVMSRGVVTVQGDSRELEERSDILESSYLGEN
ncbi:MAG: ABC transporter ATP-binding protein [Actinomycetes bacterium]